MSLDSLATGMRFSLLDDGETDESSEFLEVSPARRVEDLLPLLDLPSRSLGEVFSLREGDFSEEEEDFFLRGELLFGDDISDDDFFLSELDDFEDGLLLDLELNSSFLSLRDRCDGDEELLVVLVLVDVALVVFLRSASAI